MLFEEFIPKGAVNPNFRMVFFEWDAETMFSVGETNQDPVRLVQNLQVFNCGDLGSFIVMFQWYFVKANPKPISKPLYSLYV